MSQKTLQFLTQTQLDSYHSQGFLVLPGFFTSDQATELIECIRSLIGKLDLSAHPRTIFRTSRHDGNQTMQLPLNGASSDHGATSSSSKPDVFSESTSLMSSTEYFLWSADHIGYFFEEGAFDDENQLKFPLEKSINKIGHTLHRDNDSFAKFSTSQKIQRLASDIGFADPIILQSMVICKQPQIGGRVDIHRDSTFLYTIPSSAVGFWFALEDCTIENGCLSFVPGSHLDNASNRRMIRKGKMRPTINNRTFMQQHISSPKIDTIDVEDGPLNSEVELQFVGADNATYPEESFISLPVSKGTLIIIHGDVVHRSAPNHSSKSRNVYTFHLIEAQNTVYPLTNWLQSGREFMKLLPSTAN